MKKQIQLMNIQIKAIDEDKYTLDAVFSTEDKDRHGDIVRQRWDLKNFKANPVILNSHNYGDAMEVIGIAEKIGVKGGQLEGKIKFAVEENPKAKVIYELYKGGFLKAFSVGFIPKEMTPDYMEILKAELLEISAVSVPANAMALAKSAGIDCKPLYKELFEEDEENEIIDDEEEEEEETPEEPEENEEPEIKEEIIEEKKIKHATKGELMTALASRLKVAPERTKSEEVRAKKSLTNKLIRLLIKEK